MQAYPDFLSREAPAGYVAGLGRGATGFTTQSDIGPARDKSKVQAPQDERFQQDPDNEKGIFDSLPYSAEDKEADDIYAQIERKMDERRKSRREAREKQELERVAKDKPSISSQFSDLKRDLKEVSFEEWSAIPEVGDLTRKKGKKPNPLGERFSAVPDSIFLSSRVTTSTVEQTGGTESTITDFSQYGQVRDKVLSLKLDQVSDASNGTETVDPRGYLTSLDSINIKSESEISDIKKARTLLKSVIATNPKHGPGWIAAARLEEVAGKTVAARELIAKGCDECPDNEDVWLEASRLNALENSKIILANAVRHIPNSVKIWMEACNLEKDEKLKRKVLQRAIEFIPNSLKLWKELINLQDDQEDAKILLSKAVECVPFAVELWLALARLETYENAKKVLNKARAAVPTSHEIWIAAAMLEESQGNESMVDTIINRAIQVLTQKGSPLNRQEWIEQAKEAEDSKSPLTCQAIVRATIEMELDEEKLKETWMEDAEKLIQNCKIVTARAVYAFALAKFPLKKGVWRRAILLEKSHGTIESMELLFKQATENCPNAQVLWLMWAKERWTGSKDVAGARKILEMAFASNPDSEQIWLAAIKLEQETREYQKAIELLEAARQRCSTEKVWMKSVVLERQLGNLDQATKLVDESLVKFPQFEKLWIIKAQLFSDFEKCREFLAKAVKQCPKCPYLWIMASKLEEDAGLVIKARAILERGRLLNPKQELLWLESIRLENRANNLAMAKMLQSKSLQECPKSGVLWAQAILSEAKPQRKARSADALKNCDNDPIVLVAVARLFWSERKLDKARSWLERAATVNPDLGDTWAWYFTFELQHGNTDSAKKIIERCLEADPKHGEKWQPIRKDPKLAERSTEEVLKLVAAECINDI